jgi:purine-binding chemotaxis protein CheW
VANYVVFRLAQQTFVIEAALILGIAPLQELLPRPQSLPFVCGLTFWAERVVPIIDVHEKLGLSDGSTSKRRLVMIVHTGSARFGMVVDKVYRVLKLDESEFHNGAVRVHGRLKRRLSVSDLLSEQETQALEPASL